MQIKCPEAPLISIARGEDALIDKLRDEGRTLMRLSQQTAGIVQAMDIGTHVARGDARIPFLVLEWLDGRTLADELAERRRQARPMPLDEAVKLLGTAARALAVAHGEKIAHRDIKPENLMIVTTGGHATLKVLDFGIAKLLDDATNAQQAKTSDAAPILTPGYAAPEQFEKKRGASGPWSDVFSLALVLVEMVSGERAIPVGSFVEVYQATVDPLVRPSLGARGVAAPESVERVLSRALDVEPSRRFVDAGAFWDALERAMLDPTAKPEMPSRVLGEDANLPTGEYVARHASGAVPVTAPTPAPIAKKADDVATADTARATTALIASSARTGPAPAPRRAWLLGGVALVVLLAAGAIVRELRSPPASSSSTPAPTPSALPISASASASESAVPISTNPQVMTLYREATEAWRGGSPDAAVAALESAAALDRGAAAVEVRLALWKFKVNPTAAREHYDLATRHAASLGVKDAALLDAAGAVMQVPPDYSQYEARLRAIAESSADDPELWFLVAQARVAQLDYQGALAAADKALALDPRYVAGWVLRGDALAATGDSGGQLESYDKCVKQAPRALECSFKLVNLRASRGECAAMLSDAKRLAEIAPKSSRAQRLLATALHATGADREAVLEALAQAWAQSSAKERSVAEPRDRAMLAVLDGDFEAALRSVRDWQSATAKELDQSAHLEPASVALELMRETGQTTELGAVSEELRRKMGAWTEPRSNDWTLTIDRYRLFAGKIGAGDFATARTAWYEKVRNKWQASGRRLDEELDWTLWVTGYGALALDAESAKAAVAEMPARVSPSLSSGRYSSVDVVVGRAYTLAGRFAEAKVPLERALGNCSFALVDATLATAGWYYLGLAREGLGDKAGAKSAFERVLARWGKSKLESSTARAAKARLDAP
ncbi:MAG: protein kinase [Polyangiaceae bacterium]